MFALSIVNAKKNYGNLRALKGIDLDVEKGEFFGLLGPNGAGKTTLISAIVGLCHLNDGSISIHGYDSRRDFIEAHALIGFSPQDLNLDRFFSIRKILLYQAGFFGVPRSQRGAIVDNLLEQFELTDKANLSYYRLSGGMQKRLLIAKAVVGNPQVLILDEPTAGIDVEQRLKLWEYLRSLKEQGTTIILTTHYIDEAEALCERVGIIHLGEIREMGRPQDLIEQYCEKKVHVKTSTALPAQNITDNGLRISVQDTQVIGTGKNIGQITERIHQMIAQVPDCHILDLKVERGSLEDVFLKVTGSRIEEGEEEEAPKIVGSGSPATSD